MYLQQCKVFQSICDRESHPTFYRKFIFYLRAIDSGLWDLRLFNGKNSQPLVSVTGGSRIRHWGGGGCQHIILPNVPKKEKQLHEIKKILVPGYRDSLGVPPKYTNIDLQHRVRNFMYKLVKPCAAIFVKEVMLQWRSASCKTEKRSLRWGTKHFSLYFTL